MNLTTWSEKEGVLLKNLREGAGLDICVLARLNCISINQLRQLEDGGDFSFYSPKIKFDIGTKILKQLGSEERLGFLKNKLCSAL